MKATIDRAGRVVIPKSLRDRLGLRAGEITVIADGAGLRIIPAAGDAVAEEGARLVVPATGARLDDELGRLLRDADQR